jgi:hypothetical protein
MVEKGFRNPSENSRYKTTEAERADSLLGVDLRKRAENM